MPPAPTLIDTLYRASFHKKTMPGWADNKMWQTRLRSARRFMLDDAMSTFLGELCTEAFVRPKLTQSMKFKIIDRLRIGARLPFETVWIEYNLRNSLVRSNELLKRAFDPIQVPEREGWLLERHPRLDTAFRLHLITQDTKLDHGDSFDTWTMPFALGWVADNETLLPWPKLPFAKEGLQHSEVTSGLYGYQSDRSGFLFSDLVSTPERPKELAYLVHEWMGVLRRVWSLLATINDLPVEMRATRPARGFFAKGAYRKFLDHSTVTLTVPVKQYTKVIRNALAIAHRRGGPVREHWRQDFRRPLSALCEHDWDVDDKHIFCTLCGGRKIWVDEHVRGDTSRGFVTHDYKVTHERK